MDNNEKKNAKPSWLSVLQSSMTAAAFAEAGEPEMAREILNTGVNSDAVLFVVQDGQLHQRAVQYAVNLCHRMDCGLAVLHIFSPEPSKNTESNDATNLLDECIDVPASLHTAQGELTKTVRRFLDEHRRIVSVVVDDATISDNGSKRRPAKQRKWWRELSCPVVFIPAT